MMLKDPRGMKRDQLVKFFEHITAREGSHGIKEAFRFKNVLSSRKKGEICTAKYPDFGRDPAPGLSQTNMDVERDTFTHDIDNHSTLRNSHEPGPGQELADESTSIMNMDPAPDPQPVRERPRPRPRPIRNKANNADTTAVTYSTSRAMFNPGQPTSSTSLLTFEPGYTWDKLITLDPSLEPSFDGQTIIDSSLLTWLTVPTNTYESIPGSDPAPVPALNSIPSPQVPRRRGKTAEMLAIEEAKILIGEGKGRRR